MIIAEIQIGEITQHGWSQLLWALAGYLIGSVPFAYLITRRMTGLDLRNEGSRNIGTLNSYEVTRKRSVGILVLIADLLKGALPVLIAASSGYLEFCAGLSVGLILGHCYPIWLRFHGGRGLATGAGVTLVIAPLLTGLWLVCFGLGMLIKRQVHVGSIAAILGTAIFVLAVPALLLRSTVLPFPEQAISVDLLRITALCILAVMMSRHVDPLRALLRGEPL